MSERTAPDPRFPLAPASATAPEETADPPDEDRRRWFQPPSAIQAVALAVALVVFGGIVGWAVTTTGDARPAADSTDVRFLQDMITHHEQAVTMSELALAGVTDQNTRRFAEEVLFFQARELGIMAYLLEGWGFDLSERPEVAMEWMTMEVPADEMPGLATEAEMEALVAAAQAGPSDEVDRLFLDLMIRHHEGGIHMAEWAAAHAQEADVRELAEIMVAHQRVEVGEYRLLQERLGFPVT